MVRNYIYIMISSTTNNKIVSLCTTLVCCYFFNCSAKDSMTTGEFISDGFDYLESFPGKKFQMGFFPHEKTSEIRRYVGIWYTMDPNTIVWVANRDNPVMDSTGVFTVAEDGDFKILSKDGSVHHFSTTTEGASPRTLKLLDNGNVVLINVESRSILWESFKTPTDTFLPGMTMVSNIKLQSWKSLKDPGSGSFVFQPDPGTNRYSILNGSTTYIWKSGNMSKDSFDENQISSKAFNLLSNTITERRTTIFPNATRYSETYMVIEPYSRLVMNHSGNIEFFSWPEKKNQWVLDWQEPKDACSIYRVCGSFGICNENNKSSLCSCMDGFEPTSLDDNRAGCKRISEIGQKNSIDTFVNKVMISMDDTTLPLFPSKNESACIKECLENSQCLAYSYTSQNKGMAWDEGRDIKQGCWFWNSEPLNLKENGEHNISFRISGLFEEPSFTAPSEKPKHERKPSFPKQVLALAIVGSALVLLSFCGISYISYKRMANRARTENSQPNIESQSNDTRSRINELLHLDHSKEDDTEGINVPYFELESLIAATNDFSEKNLLGQGGFGPVYKGTLPGGQEIAVKRLSSLSGQGLREFKNEVILIAKLQHRNLVRLMGYCTKGEEKMLLYEYLPNRSLDLFIFD